MAPKSIACSFQNRYSGTADSYKSWNVRHGANYVTELQSLHGTEASKLQPSETSLQGIASEALAPDKHQLYVLHGVSLTVSIYCPS